MDKKSFVFHFDYLSDIPDELRGVWALYIIDYAQTGLEPAFSSWMEQKLWNSIKSKIDAESEKYQTKINNLRHSKRENLHSIEGQIRHTENQIRDTEIEFRDAENAIRHTENDFREPESQFRAGVNVNVSDYVNVNDNVSEYVNVGVNNQPTSEPLNINSTFSALGYPLDSSTISKIGESLSSAGIELTATSVKYAYEVISNKSYGKGSGKQKFSEKSAEERKKIFVSALLKYPGDVFTGFSEWLDAEREKSERAIKRRAEQKALQKPPSVCKCGAELIPKGGGYVCFSCRRTYEIINGNWEVNE